MQTITGSTYAYALEAGDWRSAGDEQWDTEVYGMTGRERYQGTRRIDGTRCAVFLCGDGLYRAITVANANVVSLTSENRRNP